VAEILFHAPVGRDLPIARAGAALAAVITDGYRKLMRDIMARACAIVERTGVVAQCPVIS
jgi:hypothetical protein